MVWLDAGCYRIVCAIHCCEMVGATAYELDLSNTMPARLRDVFDVSPLSSYLWEPNEPPLPVLNFTGTKLERVLA